MIDTTGFTLEDVKDLDLSQIYASFQDSGSPVIDSDQGAHVFSKLLHAPDKVRHTQFHSDAKPWAAFPWRAQHTSSELAYLYDMPKRLGKGNYANLGTFKGASTSALAFGVRDNEGGRVYAVDLWDRKGKPGYLKSFLKTMDGLRLNEHIQPCKGYTFEWANKLANAGVRFKFIFVDADHHYESAKLDFDLWLPLLDVNGIMSFHDIDFTSVHVFLEKEVTTRPDLEEIDPMWSIRSFRKIA